MSKNKKLRFLFMAAGILSLSAQGVFAETVLEEKAAEAVSGADALLKTEQAVTEKVQELAVQAEEAKPVSEVWIQNPPVVKVSPFGQEIKINVNFDPKMGKEKIDAVQSVKLETEKGEFLGLKTYSAEEISREAEFMVSPEALKIDKVKVTISSSTEGEYSTTVSLVIPKEEPKEEVSSAPAAESAAEASVPAVAEKKEKKPKKKKWGW